MLVTLLFACALIDPAAPMDRVDVGPTHACAVRDDYTVHCGGNDSQGQSDPPGTLGE
jgi:hypothetical protein